MKVGFSGSRTGMSQQQMVTFGKLISELPTFTEFHHGCCCGSDENAVCIIDEMGDPFDARKFRVFGYPGNDEKYRSERACQLSDVLDWPRPMLERNRIIVNSSDMMFATPDGPEEARGSGTWHTIRFARSVGKRLTIIWPNGTITTEN